jgi:hypothetical protein
MLAFQLMRGFAGGAALEREALQFKVSSHRRQDLLRNDPNVTHRRCVLSWTASSSSSSTIS